MKPENILYQNSDQQCIQLKHDKWNETRNVLINFGWQTDLTKKINAHT